MRRIAAFFALVAVWAASAEATVVVIPSLEEMTLASEVVAEVTVLDQRVVKDKGRVLTFTRLAVDDGIKGAKSGEVLEVFQVGGQLDGLSAWIVGAHHFQQDERLIFFGMHHRQRGANVVIPYGIGFGLFSVTPTPSGDKVTELVGDVAVVSPRGKAGGAAPMGPPPQRVYDSLPVFKETLRAVIAGKDVPPLPRMQKVRRGDQAPSAATTNR